jgi:alpha-L-fucosidase
MFIHWGLYAQAARHEWVKNHERLTDEQYQKYFDTFAPDLYDPRDWARRARQAGMKYFVITTKHHEGFCLWDSAVTEYKATACPAGRDLLAPMVEAFRDEGLKVGFYYSLIDWHHPEFPIDRNHPQRDDQDARKAAQGRDVSKYAEYMHAQVRELLTGFGPIDLMWFDFSYPGPDGKGRDDWQSRKLLDMVYELQPNVLVNNRLDLPDEGDFVTPEQVQPREPVTDDQGRPVVWEACQTFSGSWGYHRDESTWKSVPQLLGMLIDGVSKGGNLLLNVGPTGRGEFDQRACEALDGIGDWMYAHDRSIYGCGPAPDGLEAPTDCRYTYNPETNRLYLHLLAWPFRHVHCPGLAGKVAYAQLLNDASEVKLLTESAWNLKLDPSTATIELPTVKPPVDVPVIEVFLK